jgi:hypothetical protein
MPTGSLIEKVRDFCESNTFEGEFEEFARQHQDLFMKLLTMERGDEHPVEFYDVYNRYLSIFEGRIERFVTQLGFVPKDFFDECKGVLEDDDVVGSERFFIEFLLASSEYDSFIMLMRGEMQDINRKHHLK